MSQLVENITNNRLSLFRLGNTVASVCRARVVVVATVVSDAVVGNADIISTVVVVVIVCCCPFVSRAQRHGCCVYLTRAIGIHNKSQSTWSDI